jgi:hypothetical protein
MDPIADIGSPLYLKSSDLFSDLFTFNLILIGGFNLAFVLSSDIFEMYIFEPTVWILRQSDWRCLLFLVLLSQLCISILVFSDWKALAFLLQF